MQGKAISEPVCKLENPMNTSNSRSVRDSGSADLHDSIRACNITGHTDSMIGQLEAVFRSLDGRAGYAWSSRLVEIHCMDCARRMFT